MLLNIAAASVSDTSKVAGRTGSGQSLEHDQFVFCYLDHSPLQEMGRAKCKKSPSEGKPSGFSIGSARGSMPLEQHHKFESMNGQFSSPQVTKILPEEGSWKIIAL